MRWRLLRRCLLFGLLGLVTSVAVAWGASVRWQLGKGAFGSATIGTAIVGNRPLTLIARSTFAIDIEEWEIRAAAPVTGRPGGELHDALIKFYRDLAVAKVEQRDPATSTRVLHDDRAARGPRASLESLADGRSTITFFSAGWPLRALRCSVQHVGPPSRTPQPFSEGAVGQHARARGAIEAPWLWTDAVATPPALATVYLPLEPRPGLLGNTIFYGLLWAILLLAPGAIRRRMRCARGRCPQCGYSLRGQPAPGCPECGHGRGAVVERPGRVAKRPGGGALA